MTIAARSGARVAVARARFRAWRGRFATHASALLGCAALLAASAPATARAADGAPRQVLESFPASGQPQRGARPFYELSLRPCEGGQCFFEVRVRSGADRGDPLAIARDGAAATPGSVLLEWPASTMPAQPRPAVPGDEPIRVVGAAAPRVWSTGEEESTVAVSASAVPLQRHTHAQEYALLVAQAAGFEHPKRRHALYVAASGKPKVAWSRSEQQGPAVSWVVVPADGAPVYVSLFFSPDDAVADTVSAQRLAWDARRQVFSEQAATPALQVVVAGSYASLQAARAARAASACFAGYAAVDTWPGKGVVPHRYVLIAVAVEPAQAGAERVRLAQCQPGILARSYPLGRLSPRSLPAR